MTIAMVVAMAAAPKVSPMDCSTSGSPNDLMKSNGVVDSSVLTIGRTTNITRSAPANVKITSKITRFRFTESPMTHRVIEGRLEYSRNSRRLPGQNMGWLSACIDDSALRSE